MASTQLLKSARVASDQRFFLLTAPALQLLFAADRGRQRIKGLAINKFNGTTSGGVLRRDSLVMSFLTRGQIVCTADIERIVAALEDINEMDRAVPLDSPSFARDTPRFRGFVACHEGGREAAESSGAEAGI